MVPRVGYRWPGGLNIEAVSSKGLYNGILLRETELGEAVCY